MSCWSGIFPGAGTAGRIWPLEHFAEVADHLIRNDRVRIIVFAGPEERQMVPQMRTVFPGEDNLFRPADHPPTGCGPGPSDPLYFQRYRPGAHCGGGRNAGGRHYRPSGSALLHPVGEQHRLIFGPSVASISVAEVYQAAHELLALSRTDNTLPRKRSHKQAQRHTIERLYHRDFRFPVDKHGLTSLVWVGPLGVPTEVGVTCPPHESFQIWPASANYGENNV